MSSMSSTMLRNIADDATVDVKIVRQMARELGFDVYSALQILQCSSYS